MLQTLWLVFMRHLPRVLRSRRLLLLAGLAALPMLPAFFAARMKLDATADSVVAHVSWFLMLQLVLPLCALIAGSAVVAEEAEDRTLSWVFMRPVSRPGFFLGRLFALLLPLLLVLGLATLGMVAVAQSAKGAAAAFDPEQAQGLTPGHGMRVLLVVLVGATAYTAVFAALGSRLKHPLMIGLGYAFVIEALFGNLTGPTMKLALSHHLRSLLVDSSAAYNRLAVQLGSEIDSPQEAWVTLASVTLVASALGAYLLRRREI